MTDLAEWVGRLGEPRDSGKVRLRRICEMCADELDVTGAGISVVTSAGNRGVVCASDPVAARIEELQFTLGEGPCVDVLRSGSSILIDDLNDMGRTTGRWPAFLREATSAGAEAVFAFPARIGADNVGVMDLYRDQPGQLSTVNIDAAVLAASAVAIALLSLDSGREDPFADDADARASYQMQVHQATGMIQVQLDVSSEEAFLSLRARAFATDRHLADVATDVVERRLRFDREDG